MTAGEDAGALRAVAPAKGRAAWQAEAEAAEAEGKWWSAVRAWDGAGKMSKDKAGRDTAKARHAAARDRARAEDAEEDAAELARMPVVPVEEALAAERARRPSLPLCPGCGRKVERPGTCEVCLAGGPEELAAVATGLAAAVGQLAAEDGAAAPVSVAANGRLAEQQRARAERAGLKPGTTLRHTVKGEVSAECLYAGPRDWRYGGVAYTSPSEAANAASAATGRRPRKLNGWQWWGVEE